MPSPYLSRQWADRPRSWASLGDGVFLQATLRKKIGVEPLTCTEDSVRRSLGRSHGSCHRKYCTSSKLWSNPRSYRPSRPGNRRDPRRRSALARCHARNLGPARTEFCRWSACGHLRTPCTCSTLGALSSRACPRACSRRCDPGNTGRSLRPRGQTDQRWSPGARNCGIVLREGRQGLSQCLSRDLRDGGN